jgi:hypothetical protein
MADYGGISLNRTSFRHGDLGWRPCAGVALPPPDSKAAAAVISLVPLLLTLVVDTPLLMTRREEVLIWINVDLKRVLGTLGSTTPKKN